MKIGSLDPPGARGYNGLNDAEARSGGETAKMAQDEKYWSKPAEEIMSAFNTRSSGLTEDEARDRLKRYGPNQLSRPRTITLWGVLKEEFTEPMILLLLVVGLVYSLWGERRDAITIFVIIVLLVFIEIGTEYRAKKTVSLLRKLSPPTVPVVRDGRYAAVAATDVVKGDVIVLKEGERVAADARCLESFGLEMDESPLTGEAAAVAKGDAALAADTGLAERSNMVFAGTTVNRGRGTAVVTAVGMETELGKITGMVLEAKEPKTPLQLAMKQLAGLLVWVAAFFSLVIPLVGFLQGKDLKTMVLTGLSLSFATIPEELPIVITMVLGVGAYALSKQNVLVKRLRAAETLGGVTVIATDKTGTITENRMTLSQIAADTMPKAFSKGTISPGDVSLLRIGVLTSGVNNTGIGGYRGDPMDAAVLEAAEMAGLSIAEVQNQYRLTKEFSFDNQRKMMSTAYLSDGVGYVFVKGAPEALMDNSSRIICDGAERSWTQGDAEAVRKRVEVMANEAMRVIAFGYKKIPDAAAVAQKEAETDLVFAGLAGFLDPPRAGVKQAVDEIQGAGVRILVVSGDHPLTVEKVAAQVGIGNGGVVTGNQLDRMDDSELRQTLGRASLFARTTAEQKMRIVTTLKKMGEVVAVTGDGINDAPALKIADIGIAMGETGTEVAREAAGMVLRDDSFISIAAGVREGRKIFDNLKKGITYYLSVKVALVLSFVAALFAGIQFPFAPVQIILLELFMDLAASATFVAEPIEGDVMKRAPRLPSERFVNREMLQNIGTGSLCLAGAVTINYFYAWYSGWGLVQAQTLAFATWLIGHLLLAFNMRSLREPLWKIGIASNRVMLVWGGVVLAFLLLVTNFPPVQASVNISSLDARSWLMALGVPFVTIFWMEAKKAVTYRRVKMSH